MNELIKITNTEKGSVVSAKELYLFLGYDKTKWSRWSSRNIIEDNFFIKDSDYVTLTHRVKGNETTDYAITISMAKELCMLAKTEKGKQARQYFLECEKKLSQVNTNILVSPSYQIENPAERARAWAVEYEEKQLLLESNAKLQFRSDFVDVVFDTDGLFGMEEVAKILKLPFGRNTMLRKLREKKVLLESNTPKQSLVNSGYFKVSEQIIDSGKFKKLVSTTYATSKGIGYIHKLFKDEFTL